MSEKPDKKDESKETSQEGKTELLVNFPLTPRIQL